MSDSNQVILKYNKKVILHTSSSSLKVGRLLLPELDGDEGKVGRDIEDFLLEDKDELFSDLLEVISYATEGSTGGKDDDDEEETDKLLLFWLKVALAV
jgi:hypothetical protein